jgi:hypothetical protein
LKEGGFYSFLENSLLSAPGKGRRQRLFFYFFKKILCRAPWQRPSAKTDFYFFKKKLFAERPVQLRSAKMGTPELGKFFPELPSVFARSTRHSGFADGPARQRGTFCFIFVFFFPH